MCSAEQAVLPSPLLSVIVPTLNADRYLEQCLARLAGVDEIIVVDGGSTDDSTSIASKLGARLVATSAGRGVQLQAGGEAARGEWLLFLHADTLLGKGWREVVADHVRSNPHAAACFRLKLDDGAWQARVIERAVAMRVELLGLPYGDQGFLISRELYEQVGGFRSLALMEDVDLVRRVGRRRIRTLGVDALTSAERWRRDGWFRRSARNLSCLIFYLLGGSPERVARYYDTTRSARG